MNRVVSSTRRSGTAFALVSVLLAALLASPVTAAEPAAPWPGASKVEPGLMGALNEAAFSAVPDETFRVQVTLRTPGTLPTAKNYRSTAGLLEVRRAVTAAQDKVLNERRAGSFELFTRYQTIPGFSAIVDETALRDLARMPEVEHIELMPVYRKMDAQSHPLANVDAMHAAGFTGDGVAIAIIDDGFDLSHAAFGGFGGFPNAKMVGGFDFGDNDSDPSNDCTAQSHGTAVAGVAAGNGGGVLGTAPDATVVALKVQSAFQGCDPGAPGFLDGDIAGAIDWAVANAASLGIRVISMSLGTFVGYSTVGSCEGADTATRNAINAAHAAGIPVMVASGNAGLCNALGSPACMGNAISVGAVYDANIGGVGFCVSDSACDGQFTNQCLAIIGTTTACFDNATSADQVTCYSNSANMLDILAPSNNALTAAAGGGTTSSFGGTSSATPFASGVVAAMMEKDSTLDGDDIRSILTSTGIDIQDVKNGLFKPRVDALAAINAVDGGTGGPTDVTVTFTSIGAEDGWVRESNENSGVGGRSASGGNGNAAIRAGDATQDRQYKAILSFDTSSIPAGATIVSATLRLRRGRVSGSNPFTSFGGSMLVDVQSGGFSGSTALQNSDFEASATAAAAGAMSNAASNGDWSEGALDPAGLTALNTTGTTQLRIAFTVDDNDDGGNDYIGYNSGDNSNQAFHPQLVVTYQ